MIRCKYSKGPAFDVLAPGLKDIIASVALGPGCRGCRDLHPQTYGYAASCDPDSSEEVAKYFENLQRRSLAVIDLATL